MSSTKNSWMGKILAIIKNNQEVGLVRVFFFLVIAYIIGGAYWRIYVDEENYLNKLLLKAQVRPEYFLRGSICDRNGKSLTGSIFLHRVFIDEYQVPNFDLESDQNKRIIKIEKYRKKIEELSDILSQVNGYENSQDLINLFDYKRILEKEKKGEAKGDLNLITYANKISLSSDDLDLIRKTGLLGRGLKIEEKEERYYQGNFRSYLIGSVVNKCDPNSEIIRLKNAGKLARDDDNNAELEGKTRISRVCKIPESNYRVDNSKVLIGNTGLEKTFNDILQSEPSIISRMVNKKGDPITQDNTKYEGKRSENVSIYVDSTIQSFAYKTLETTVKKYRANNGSAVVLDAKTGGILALASYPEFDGIDYKNKAVSAVYIGSVVKPLIAAKALDMGKVGLNDYFDNRPKNDGCGIRNNDTNQADWLNLADILRYSSNIGISQVIEKIDNESLLAYFNDLHLTENYKGASGISLSEADGASRIDPKTLKNACDKKRVAYAYGHLISPLDLAGAFTMIANNGKFYAPYIENSKRVAPNQVIKAESAQQILSMMRKTFESYAAKYPQLKINDSVAGKTGTAQKYIKGKGFSNKHIITSFVGIAPVESPQVIVVVAIDEPKGLSGELYGVTVSAPAAVEIIKESLDIVGAADYSPEVKQCKGQ